MRHFFLFACPLLLCMVAQAQNQRFSYINLPLDQVLADISKHLKKYELHVKGEGLDEYFVSMPFEEATLPETLEEISRNFPIKYKIEGNVVWVEALQKSLVQYRGTMVDGDRNPIDSIIVTMCRTQDRMPLKRTITNKYGTYTLDCYEDSVLMVFSHPEYISQCINATESNLGIIEMQKKQQQSSEKKAVPCLGGIVNTGYNGPEFPGGDSKLKQFVSENIIYPSEIKNQKDFTAVIELLIKENGTAVLGKIKKPSNANDRIVREVKRVIKAMPTWEPAKEVLADGISVPQKSVVELTIPFTRRSSNNIVYSTIHVTMAGTLAQLLTEEQQDTCRFLSVSGPINSKDILTLRRMAGADGGKGHLERLDLSHAKIVTDKDTPYLTLDMAESGVMVWVTERGAIRDKTQFKAYTPTFMGRQNNIRHYNESKPRLMAATDTSTPTYTIEHSPGWVGNYQNELRYMEEASHWNAAVTLNPTKMRMKHTLYDNGKDPRSVDDFVINKDTASFKLTRLQQNAMRKLKGHYVEKENGRYIYKSYTRKNKFCQDMFYECSSLRTVVLPNGTKSNVNVYVHDDPIRYL